MEIPNNWTFESQEVAEGFDEHVREQLPWYDMVTDAVCFLTKAHLPYGGVLYDIGASTGNITKSLEQAIHSRKIEAISLETSQEMCAKFQGVGALEMDEAQLHNYKPCDVIIIFLTLMFVPVVDRKKLITKLKSSLNEGGAIIIVDKFQGHTYTDTIMAKHLLKQKVANGASCESVLQKEESLLGVQRPLNREDYSEFSAFFKFGLFEGIIYEKNFVDTDI